MVRLALVVIFATASTLFFNWAAASGKFGKTVGEISAKYSTSVTPSDYAFSIWALIYAGLIAFSLYQALPRNLERLDSIKWFYLLTCALNVLWLYAWTKERIIESFITILFLLVLLALINARLKKTENTSDYWLVKFPFGIYFGWVTAATVLNFAVFLVYFGIEVKSGSTAIFLIALTTLLAVIVCWKMRNYFYPLPIAWALGAIAVAQSGSETLIVVSSVVGVIICLIASLSFVLQMPSMRENL
ncbi:MAG: tryptophan-rich sensory protein [Pyrinomonadaceae bacterium]|nr:tryptophan-rich sensory protein [Pyrinomonadaceae bacterium]MCX7639082.1 tryptophan-rich sensory protein [Pyrinomonadaceae bacterium]MDW8303697.1 tryptophan-rich sensory protein [Acidobacteriota bacterium]